MPHHNFPVVEGFFSKGKSNPYTIGLIPIAIWNTILAVRTEHGKALERVVIFKPYDSADYEQSLVYFWVSPAAHLVSFGIIVSSHSYELPNF